MNYDTIIGLSASALTSTSLIPQVVKLLKEKKSDGISFVMLLVLLGGVSLWVYYGILKSDWIIIISNALAVVINILIVSLSIYYKPKDLN